MLKSWKAPTAFLILLVLAMVFRWDSIGSTTKDGVITTTKMDRWNGAVWQETIKKGSYTEKIVQPSWIERSREPIEKQVEYQEAVYTDDKSSLDDKPKTLDEIFSSDNTFKFINKNVTYVTKTKTAQFPPDPIYWLSRNGLTKIWGYITAIMAVWLFLALILKNKKKINPTISFEKES